MSSTKLRAYTTLDAMKRDEKIAKPEKKGQDNLDDVIQQALGKEPFLPFSTSGDGPVHWIQLLHALDQQGSIKNSRNLKVDNFTEVKEHPNEICSGANLFSSEMNGVKESVRSRGADGNYMKGTKNTSEQIQSLKIPEAVAFAQAAAKANGEPEKYLPGWPLLSPSKVQLQKCSKCSLEFCSAINYRRHVRVHRRTLNIVKDSSKTRNLLAAFWDKLSLDNAKELVSFHNETVEGVTGSSIIRALSSWVQKPGFSSLPQKYVKAGATLLDVVHARPSSFPMTSQNLFSTLDDASEKTFLIAGTALSLQKYVFGSEAGKYALDMKNLVACASFLLEQILVKAWIADKDREALRCQKLLVEEEEAAQKRQTDLLERKRLKKLRQRKHKAKELSDVAKADSEVNLSDSIEGMSSSGSPSTRAQSETDMNISDEPRSQGPVPIEPARCAEQRADHQIQNSGCLQPIPARQHLVPKQNRNDGNYRDQKADIVTNRQKVWTWKMKTKSQAEATNEQSSDSSIVLIGSISVALGEADSQHHHNVLTKGNFLEKVKSDSCGAAMKLWRPVSRQKSRSVPHHGNISGAGEIKENEGSTEAANLVSRDVDCLTSSGMDDVCTEKRNDSLEVHSGSDLSKPRLFSSDAAEAFLAQSKTLITITTTQKRWKEAVEADHVKLVLPREHESSTTDHHVDSSHPEAQPIPSDRLERSVLGNAENRMTGVRTVGPTVAHPLKPKFRPKHGKSFALKYVPKK